MCKINGETFWMECYSLTRYVNCVSPQRKNTPPLWIDTFDQSSYKHCALRRIFEFQQKVDSLWNYQVQSKKLQTSWHRLFFNLFTVTNWRHCVSKLLVLVKFLPPIRTCSTSLIESFHFDQRRKVGGAARFSFHICQYIKEMIMIMTPGFLDILDILLLEFFIKTNEFVRLLMSHFLWKINNI